MTSKASRTLSDAKAKTKFFTTQFPGEEVRLTLPDGGVALVGDEPKELPERFWRAALANGCQVADEKPLTAAQKRAALRASPENDSTGEDTLIERMVAKIKEIFNGDPNDPRYSDALTTQGIPTVAWLIQAMGVNVTSAQRDEAFAKYELQAEDDDGDEADEEDGDEEDQE